MQREYMKRQRWAGHVECRLNEKCVQHSSQRMKRPLGIQTREWDNIKTDLKKHGLIV
jgi:hypothetical protein